MTDCHRGTEGERERERGPRAKMETEKGEVMVEEERATGEKTEETGDRRGTMC